MKRISYCGEPFLTTDGAADALLELVVALPDGHNSELLELPAVVVGPGSELISVPEESTSGEPDTLEAVAYLRDRVLTLRAPGEMTYAEALLFAEYEWDTEYLL